MAPIDQSIFEPSPDPSSWVVFSPAWNAILAASSFSVAEKVHLLRVANQRQLICDIDLRPDSRSVGLETLKALGLHTREVVVSGRPIILAGGNAAVLEYMDFRGGHMTELEAGLLYGYPASAISAFGSLIGKAKGSMPRSAADYFLGGVDSARFSSKESSQRTRDWALLRKMDSEVIDRAEEIWSAWSARVDHQPIQHPEP